jgi:hypothetical protein
MANDSIQVVTLADREPWTSLAMKLGQIINSMGYRFHIETTSHGERPWQAKRFALRQAFNRDSSSVYWIDADYEVIDEKLLQKFLQLKREYGLHCRQLFPEAINSVKKWGRKPNQAGPDQNLKIYSDCLRENNLSTSTHFGGSIIAYNLDSALGLKLCSIWDRIANKLLHNSTTWTDEISIGIAADSLKIPIIPDLLATPHGLHHLRLGHSMNYFLDNKIQ